MEDLPQSIAAVVCMMALAWRYLPATENIKSNINTEEGNPLWP